MPTAYFSLGSNLGDRMSNLWAALTRLDTRECRITSVSSVYETDPIGETPEPVPSYLNCAARAETDLDSYGLLEHTQAVERECGRTPTFRWGPRMVDIDILLYDHITIRSAELSIPHPRMTERAFVLIPVAEVEPDLVLPDGSPIQSKIAEPDIQSQGVHQFGRFDLRTGEKGDVMRDS